MKHIKLFENFEDKESEENIKMSQADFDNMDFDSKKSLLQDTYPSLEFGDMTEDEFDEYFDITEAVRVGHGPEIKFGKYTGHIIKHKYGNGRVALEMIGSAGSKYEGEPIVVASVNIPHEKLAADEVVIKNYSENEGILDVLVKAKIISAPIRETEKEGFPICKLLI
jgi:hypothetical protein